MATEWTHRWFVNTCPTWPNVLKIERVYWLETSFGLAQVTRSPLLWIASTSTRWGTQMAVKIVLRRSLIICTRTTLLNHLLIIQTLLIVRILWILSSLKQTIIRLKQGSLHSSKIWIVKLTLWLLLWHILILKTSFYLLFLHILGWCFWRVQAERAENDIILFHIIYFTQIINRIGNTSTLLAAAPNLIRCRRATVLKPGRTFPWNRGNSVRLHESAQGDGAAQ